MEAKFRPRNIPLAGCRGKVKHMLRCEKLFALISVACLILVAIIFPGEAAFGGKTWVLKHEEPFRDEKVRGAPVQEGFEFTLFVGDYSYMRFLDIPFHVDKCPRITAEINVEQIQNAGTGVALGNGEKGFSFEVFPEGKSFLQYWEKMPFDKIEYWKVWSGKVPFPQPPFSLRLEYQSLPAEAKGYINDDIILSISLEENPVCDVPRVISESGIKIAESQGLPGAKAIFSYLVVKQE
jgi:hypothetical protein